MSYLERAKALFPTMVENRRALHQMPELGLDLPKTRAFVAEKLTEMGIEPVECGGGITGLIGGKKEGPVFLLRADMDALPMREESGLEFASACDAAHTCGHDMHTTMLLGAAKLLKEDEDNLPGTVKLMFQPAEEILEGAKSMIAAGVLENPKVDAAMGVHVAAMVPTGFIGYNTGVVNTSSDGFVIDITGKGGHGASPHESIDPINVGVQIYQALQTLISREINSQDQVVLTIGMFQGGSARNIVPETAMLGGTLRTVNDETRAYMLRRIEEVATCTAQGLRAKATMSVKSSTCALRIDSDVADCIGPAFSELFGKGAQKLNQTTNGSEDFAEVTARVPSMFFVVGTGSREQGYTHGLHHPEVRFDENSLPFGAAAFAQGARAYLDCHQ